MKVDGSCHCGYITIEGDADPEKTTVCHCTDCQTGTGSAFILRQRQEFVPKRQNWFRSALPWVTTLGSVQRNEKQA